MEKEYDTQKAQVGFNAKRVSLGNKLAGLKQERKTIGQSIYTLEKEMPSLKGTHAIARADTLLREKRGREKEIEIMMTKVEKDREGMSLTDFMGDAGAKVDTSKMKRSEMSDQEKVTFIASNGMDEYKGLNY